MKTLVAFSGGLDSIYVLWRELVNTNNEVTAVFYNGDKITNELRDEFNVLNVEDKNFCNIRWIQLQKITNAMMAETRQFQVMKESYDPVFLNKEDKCFNHGAALRTAMAVRRINNGEYDKLVSGVCRDNDGYQINRNSFVRNETASSLMTKYFIKHARRGELSLPLLDMKYTTANALSELPKHIVQLNRSCTSSLLSNAIACNYCYKCLMHSYSHHLLSEGKTPDEIYDIYTEKSLQADGSWRSQKAWICEEIPSDLENSKRTFPMPEWGHSYIVPG